MEKIGFSEPQTTSVQILQRANSQDVDNALAADLRKGSICGAHWFRIADLWYKMNHGYNNPLNMGNVNSELLFIDKLSSTLMPLVSGNKLVFFGVGVGDTELAFVDFQLAASKSSEIVLIDINPLFLRLFVGSLVRRKLELTDVSIKYLAISEFFERVTTDITHDTDDRESNILLVCLGSTVGNYSNTGEIFDIFQRVTKLGDRICMGYQLETHLSVVFQKYAENGLYRELIGNFLKSSQRKRIKWTLNSSDSTIEAWLDETQIFRSKKFKTDSMRTLAANYGWQELLCETDCHNNLCIHMFERK